MIEHHPLIKAGLDIAAGVAVISALFDHMPQIAAGLSALYYIYRFYEIIIKKKS
jgi:hypothetical protein